MDLIIFLVIGAFAGWLAGVIMKGGGFGVIGNIIVGILGAIARRLAAAQSWASAWAVNSAASSPR